MWKAPCSSGVQVDVQQEGCGMEMLNLDEALRRSDEMAELPLVENFVFIMQECRKTKNLACAKRVHAHICSKGLEAHRGVGNYIVPMFVECGSVSDAQQVFDSLPYRNEHSWTSLILGYIQCGQTQHAFNLYRKMQQDSVRPSSYTLLALLKACAKLKDVERGREIHAEIAEKGFGKGLIVGNTLVDMYAKCGSLLEAQKVFDELPHRDVVSWNILIAGYAERGYGREALKRFEQMELDDVSPDTVTFVHVLKACGSMGAIEKGHEIHANITQRGFGNVLSVGNTLIDMYGKCGLLSEAQDVFENLPVRDVVSWTALIAGYAEHGRIQEVLKRFEEMQLEGVSPNSVTLVCVLKACGSMRALTKGQEIHAVMAQKGLGRDLFVGNTLVDMYVKCGAFREAREVFDRLPHRDVVSWTVLIAGYAEHGPGQEALKCFEGMQLEGVSPNTITYVCLLKACGSIGAIAKGREIHAEIVLKGFGRDVFVGSTLVDMYAKGGSLSEARETFDELPVRNVVSWNALIAGYAEHGPSQEALKCFEMMQLEGVSLDTVTFVCVLKACSSMGAIGKGREVHAKVSQKGFGRDLSIGNTLVDMYAKCGSLPDAREVFDELPVRDVVSWTALIAGYAEHGPGQEALKCFEQMEMEGISPNVVTFMCALKACCSVGTIGKGREIHAQIALKGFGRGLSIGNALVDMYAKCGSLSEAQEAFDKLLVRNAVSWTALIAGYADHGPSQEALKCFELMQLDGISPDAFTFACVLKVCGIMGAVDKGREIHMEVIQKGFGRDPFVGNTLVDMYAKCGSLSEAWEAFDKLPAQDVVSWNAMIKGYGVNHEGDLAVQCFDDMQERGMKVDAITFTCLLNACSHTNMVFKSQEYFKMMIKEYGMEPITDHYISFVDLLAQSGHLSEAEEFLEMVWCPPSKGMWTALLSACKTFVEAELGARCFQQLVRMNPESSASYVLMANIYASAGRWEDAYRLEELRKHAGLK